MRILLSRMFAVLAATAVPLISYGQTGAGGGYPPGAGAMQAPYGPFPAGPAGGAYGAGAPPQDARMPAGNMALAPQYADPADAAAYGPSPYGQPQAPYGPSAYETGYSPDAYGVAAYGDPACDTGYNYGKYHVSLEYLNWRAKGNQVPVLVTTAEPGTPQTEAGQLGLPTTSILFGGGGINDDTRAGFRTAFGFWPDPSQQTGYEAQYFGLEDGDDGFSRESIFSTGAGNGIIARPFFNAELGVNDANLVAFPGFDTGFGTADLDGSIRITTETQTHSAGLLRKDLVWTDTVWASRTHVLWGYRYFSLTDDLQINDRTDFVGGPFGAGTFIETEDLFETENEFHGVEIGTESQFYSGRWTLDVLTKIALGNSHEKLRVRGSSTVSDGVVTTESEGGFLAQPTNIGEDRQNEFAVIPELGLTLGCQLTTNLRATLGYSFVYYSHVVRTGDQIDLALNPTQFQGGFLIGEARPERRMEDTDYYLYGCNLGLEYIW